MTDNVDLTDTDKAQDKTAELIGLLRRVAKARVEEAEEAGNSLPLAGLCEWEAATALEACHASKIELAEYLDKVGDVAADAVSRADKVEAENARLRVAFAELNADWHQRSDRPCPTCDPITSLLGKPFGCAAYRIERVQSRAAPAELEMVGKQWPVERAEE